MSKGTLTFSLAGAVIACILGTMAMELIFGAHGATNTLYQSANKINHLLASTQ